MQNHREEPMPELEKNNALNITKADLERTGDALREMVEGRSLTDVNRQDIPLPIAAPPDPDPNIEDEN
jgi:hypothetical protein